MGHILKQYINSNYGNSKVLFDLQLKNSKLPDWVKLLVAQIIDKGVQEEHFANSIVRAFNEYLALLKDPTIYEQIEACLQNSEKSENLIRLYKLIFPSEENASFLSKYIKNKSFSTLYHNLGCIDHIAIKMMSQLDQLELETFGTILPHITNRDAIRKHLKIFLILALSKTKDSLKEKTKELQSEEIENFYQGLNQLITTYYPVNGWVKNGIHYFLVKILNNSESFTRIVDSFIKGQNLSIEKEQIEEDVFFDAEEDIFYDAVESQDQITNKLRYIPSTSKQKWRYPFSFYYRYLSILSLSLTQVRTQVFSFTLGTLFHLMQKILP